MAKTTGSRPIARARTASATDRAGRVRLRDQMETLWARDSKLRRLDKPYRRNVEDVDLHFFPGPLPFGRLPDGTRPFVPGKEAVQVVHGGELPLSGLDDPRVGPLWSACLAGFGHAGITAFVRPASFRSVCVFTIELDFAAIGGRFVKPFRMAAKARAFTHGCGDSAWEDLRRLARAVGLFDYVDKLRLKGDESQYRRIAASNPGMEWSATMHASAIPPTPDLAGTVLGRLAAFEGAGGAVEKAEFRVLCWEPYYDPLRLTLNALTGGWSYTLGCVYDPKFDPFTYAGVPPDGEEFRFPVAVHRKRRREFNEPTLQVDVVHDAAGTHLEFLSADGPTEIRRRADLGDIELEGG